MLNPKPVPPRRRTTRRSLETDDDLFLPVLADGDLTVGIPRAHRDESAFGVRWSSVEGVSPRRSKDSRWDVRRAR